MAPYANTYGFFMPRGTILFYNDSSTYFISGNSSAVYYIALIMIEHGVCTAIILLFNLVWLGTH